MERRKRRSPLDEYIDALEDSPDKLQKCSHFYQQLRQFYRRKWGCQLKVPHIQGIEVDLYKLYDIVVSMGGWIKVSINEKWFEVANALGITDDTLVAEHGIKMLYMRYLSKYEQSELTGDTDDHDNELLNSRNRNRGFSSLATSDNPISMPKMTEKPRPEHVDTEYAKIVKAILSGLPNEVDFALNVCTIMSHPGPKMLRLSKCPQLIDALMAHLGIFEQDSDGLGDLYLKEWSKAPKRDFLGFWHNSGLSDPEIKALVPTSNKKMLVGNGEEELFTGVYPAFDPLDPVSWRINQILAIFRNWSFESINKPVLASNWSLMKFLLVCANCKWTSLVNHSLDVLSNISTDIDLTSEGATASNYLLLKTVSECIFSDDKLRIIRGLEILAGLCNMDQNESVVCEFLTDKILARIFDVLAVKDIMLCIYTLESLYQLSELGRVLCQRLSGFPHSVDIFVDLATTDAASFGQSGLAGIKVVEFQGPPMGAHLNNRIPPHIPSTPGQSMRHNLPPPMTPINPRLPPPMQRIPSSNSIPPVPNSPQRFVNPNSTNPANQLPAVSAALASPTPSNAESKLEVLTTKFIKDHCVADPNASTVRGELYASYVDHMRNVHSILSMSSQMFSNVLKKCFPEIVIKSIRRPTEPPTMSYIVEGLRYNREPLQNGDHQVPTPPTASVTSHPVMQQMLASSSTAKVNHSNMNGDHGMKKEIRLDVDICSNTSDSRTSDIAVNQVRPGSAAETINVAASKEGKEVRFEVCTAAVEARSLMGDHEKHETRIIRVENVFQSTEKTVNPVPIQQLSECNGNGVDHSPVAASDPIEAVLKDENSMEDEPSTSAQPVEQVVSIEKHSNPGTPRLETNGLTEIPTEYSNIQVENGSNSNPPHENSTEEPSNPSTTTDGAQKPVVNGVSPKKKKTTPKKPSAKSKKGGTTDGAKAGPFAADFARPGSSKSGPTTSQPKGDYMCEWDGCGRMFVTPTAVLFHNAQDHVSESTMVCRWPSCDGTLRSRWSLVTHLQDHHCSEHILREAARKRHEAGEANYMAQIKALLEQTKEVSHHPGYSKHAAFEAIRRHAFNYIPRDLTDEPEGPVTKSIRLTSCLILRNLVRYSTEGRRLIRKYESHLSWMALSRLECSAALAQLLNELQQHAVGPGPETSTTS